LGYIYTTDEAGQHRLAKGHGIARFQFSRYDRYGIDHDIIGHDIDYDIMTMIS
jgi:hypothetical protein